MKLELTFKYTMELEDDVSLNDVLDMRSQLAIALERRREVIRVDDTAPVQFRSAK